MFLHQGHPGEFKGASYWFTGFKQRILIPDENSHLPGRTENPARLTNSFIFNPIHTERNDLTVQNLIISHTHPVAAQGHGVHWLDQWPLDHWAQPTTADLHMLPLLPVTELEFFRMLNMWTINGGHSSCDSWSRLESGSGNSLYIIHPKSFPVAL